MKRREFMTHASRNMATAALIGTAGRWSHANDTLRIGIIGMGGRGGDHMKAFAKMDGVEVVAISDPDERRTKQWAAEHQKLYDRRPAEFTDPRKIIDDPSIDAVSIATCNHWHALAGIWACQSGKHAYVEKPVCHNVFEGRQLVNAGIKYKRVVQGGTQRRSYGLYKRAVELLHDGVIGDIYMGRALVYGPRESIGFEEPKPVPSYINWDVWLGPAQEQPYHENLAHYNWHWFWEFGNGELGNNGSHILDIIRWGMKKGLPNRIHSTGGRYAFHDQGQTPNVQSVTYEFNDGSFINCEIRNLPTNGEADHTTWGGMFYGSKGYMTINDDRYRVFLGRNKEPEPDQGRAEHEDHFANFIAAARANDPAVLNGGIEEIYLSCAYCNLGNIAYRLGRKLVFDPASETFLNDPEANRYLSRDYREPFVVPKQV